MTIVLVGLAAWSVVRAGVALAQANAGQTQGGNGCTVK